METLPLAMLRQARNNRFRSFTLRNYRKLLTYEGSWGWLMLVAVSTIAGQSVATPSRAQSESPAKLAFVAV
jgi:hypothetical protein